MKPFYEKRFQSTTDQIAPLVDAGLLGEMPDAPPVFYPNPTNGKAVMENSTTENGSAQIKVFNALGREMTGFVFSKTGELDISGLPDGAYLVLVEKGGHAFWAKLVKLRH